MGVTKFVTRYPTLVPKFVTPDSESPVSKHLSGMAHHCYMLSSRDVLPLWYLAGIVVDVFSGVVVVIVIG